MTLKEMQTNVDRWIKEYGVRYFDPTTNTLLLQEEMGEFSRLIARKYGEQSFKKPEAIDVDNELADEIADILFVLTCLANQMNIDLTEVVEKNIRKKTQRDHSRHHNNNKLK